MTTIEYTPEQLNQVEQYASIYLKISDIAVLFDIPAEQLREDIADRSTEVSKRYHKGKAASKVKSLLPNLSEATRDFHRWRYNEMILETYQMAKKRKDTKTMEKAATSYAKYNRIDVEDESTVPYHMIVVQPFFPTTDPRVVGINPVPNIDERIKKLTKELGASNPDTLNIEYEEADINFEEIFDEKEPKE